MRSDTLLVDIPETPKRIGIGVGFSPAVNSAACLIIAATRIPNGGAQFAERAVGRHIEAHVMPHVKDALLRGCDGTSDAGIKVRYFAATASKAV